MPDNLMDDPFLKYINPVPVERHPECIDLMVRRIVDAVGPRRVILFGSRARGDHHPRSDVDLLVEMDGRLNSDQILDVGITAGVSVANAPLAKDIVVLGSEQVEGESKSWYSVAHHALKDGKVLYERSA